MVPLQGQSRQIFGACSFRILSALVLAYGFSWMFSMAPVIITGDNTCLVVGSESGYRLYSLNNVDDLELIYSNDVEETYIVERLLNTSLLATVELSDRRKLILYNYKKGIEMCNYLHKNTILAVCVGRSRLVVCLEDSLYIYDIRNMKLLHTIEDTPPNPRGLCVLSKSQDNCLLAYPSSTTTGIVHIFDTVDFKVKTMFLAHTSPLAALAFNLSGTRIATASEMGTMIRVFSSTNGQKLYNFQRGVTRCVDICCLAFSTCSNYLCCSSNTETVHVFKFEEPTSSFGGRMEESSWMGYFWSYLPTQVTNVLAQARAFATAYLPTKGVKSVLSITKTQNQLRLLVATEEAKLYIYNLDPQEGGKLTLYKQHRLDHFQDSTESTTPTES